MQTKKLNLLQSQEIPWMFLCILVFPDKLQCNTFRDLLHCRVDQTTEVLEDYHHILVKVPHYPLISYQCLTHKLEYDNFVVILAPKWEFILYNIM